MALRTAVPVDGKRLACWLLLGHADNAWGAAVGAAQARAAHTVGPATHAHALPYLRAHQVPGVHGQDAPVKHQNKSHDEHKASSHYDIIRRRKSRTCSATVACGGTLLRRLLLGCYGSVAECLALNSGSVEGCYYSCSLMGNLVHLKDRKHKKSVSFDISRGLFENRL